MGQEIPSFLDGDASFLRGGVFDMIEGRSQDALGLLSLQLFTRFFVCCKIKKKNTLVYLTKQLLYVTILNGTGARPIWELIHCE